MIENWAEAVHSGDMSGVLADHSNVGHAPVFQLTGRAAFDNAIENDASSGLPDIQLTLLVEEGDIVIAEGAVQTALKSGGRIDALFCDVFHFRDDKICRLVTYQVDRYAGDQTRRAFDA